MSYQPGTVGEALAQAGVTRREFLKFCGFMAATLALKDSFAPVIARALQTAKKPTVVYLEYQDCAGNTESLLRAAHPTISQLILNTISLDYHETIMAPAGAQAEKSLDDALAISGHIVIVEGSVPLGAGGAYCVVGGDSAVNIVRRASKGAAMVIASGTCAAYGGIPAAAPNPTGAVPVSAVVSGVPIVNVPACPMNVDNMVALIVHHLTFGGIPELDNFGRPLFAYRKRIHDHCERRAHFDSGQFVEIWGDQGHRLGWCLYHMGCKGPETYQNCPDQRWNGGTSWPVGAGHNCIGCSEPAFWDTMTPFYRRLPQVPGFGVESTADTIGIVATGITAAAIGAHAIGTAIRKSVARAKVVTKPETPAETKPTAPKETQHEGGKDAQDRH